MNENTISGILQLHERAIRAEIALDIIEKIIGDESYINTEKIKIVLNAAKGGDKDAE